MPPKRQSTDSASTNPAKKSKTDTNGNADLPKIPRDPRWSKVSASANADMEFKMITRDPVKAFSWICLCEPRFHGEEEDDEDEDEEDGYEGDGEDGKKEENGKKDKASCDRGETCPCMKNATEHPGHPWLITMAGIQKVISVSIQAQVRDPDTMGMYTYNDHFGYGVLELAQNLLLDYDQAKGDWKKQWSICEAMIMFFVRGVADPMFGIDDGEGLQVLIGIIKTMFLTMLATLERNDLLKPDSEVKNLGQIMALYIRYVADFFPDFSIESEDLDTHILAYATKHNIELKGLSKMQADREDMQEEADKIKLPAPTDKKDDPWGWEKTLKEYEKMHGPIGGDQYDITTWTSAERKKHSFDKRDPLDKKMIDALKQGLVMQLA